MPYPFAYEPEIDPQDTRVPGYTPAPAPANPNRLRQYGQALMQGGIPSLAGAAMGAPMPQQQKRQYGSVPGLIGIASKLIGA